MPGLFPDLFLAICSLFCGIFPVNDKKIRIVIPAIMANAVHIRSGIGDKNLTILIKPGLDFFSRPVPCSSIYLSGLSFVVLSPPESSPSDCGNFSTIKMVVNCL